MDVQRLASVWSGAEDDAYGTAAVTGTLAIALKLMGRSADLGAADQAARQMWASRDRAHMGHAA